MIDSIPLSEGRVLKVEIQDYGETSGISPEIIVGIYDTKNEIWVQDVCLVRAGYDNDVQCLVWEDADDEDYTYITNIRQYDLLAEDDEQEKEMTEKEVILKMLSRIDSKRMDVGMVVNYITFDNTTSNNGVVFKFDDDGNCVECKAYE